MSTAEKLASVEFHSGASQEELEILDKLAAQSDEDLQLWEQYKKTNSSKDAQLLMERMEPLIRANVRKWQGGLPPSAFVADGMVRARQAIDTYDPDRGTKLSTHVWTQLQPISRLLYQHQNIARIPEARIRLIGEYNDAKQRLVDRYNREPSDAELADELRIGKKQVGLLRKEMWKDVVDSGVGTQLTPVAETNTRAELLDFLYYDLSSREKVVFEYMVGYNGRAKIGSARDISIRTGIPEREVLEIKASIAKQLKKAI